MGISPVKCDSSARSNMCHIMTIVSGAVSLGVLAGVLSGIVYVVLVGLKWVGKLRLSLEEEALKGRREENFLSETVCVKCKHQNGTLSNGSVASERCCEKFNCNGSVCSGSGNHLRKRGARRISENWSEEKDSPDSEDSNDSKTVVIREEIEKLVEEMVGDSLDGVSVGKLSKHSSYLAMFAKHHEALCQELAKLGYALHISLLNKNVSEVKSPRVALSTLKSLVEKVVAEAMKLPKMKEVLQSQTSTEEIGNENNFSNKSYEDILATAILNKVIEQCQRRQEQDKRKKHKRSVKSARNQNNNIIYNGEDGDDPDTLYNSDWSGTSRSEQMSLTIEEHIEEITTTYENSEEDEFDEEIDFNGAIPFPESGRVILNVAGDRGDSDGDGDTHSSATELITTGNSWEENWLFQRKRLRSGGKSHHPVPVPMLVPNPSQDFRALIGGVDADDLSEMSECSDSLLEEVVLAADGRDEEEEGEEERGNYVVRVPEGEENLTSLNSESSCPSLSEKERDVSVDYECFRKFEIELRDPALQRSLDSGKAEIEECNQPPKCRIAEREKEKWNHPVQLADNPYSMENILKREQKKRMDYFRTGNRREESVEFPSGIANETTLGEILDRGHYIKASRYPTGDPNVRSTPETEEFEPFEEVSDQMTRRSRFSLVGSICDCPIGKPIQEKFHSVKRRKSHSRSFSQKSITTENLSFRFGSLRHPPEGVKRIDLTRRIGELSHLEELTLKENIDHVVFRAKNATPNFIINPLFEDNLRESVPGEIAGNGDRSSDGDGYPQQKQSRGHESGYGSDAHDCSSDSSEFWRLTPPDTPEMLESSLITAFELRRKNREEKNSREKQFFDTFPKSRQIRHF